MVSNVRWCWMALALVAGIPAVPAAPCSAQHAAEVTARVRPAKVRVGDTFVITIRVGSQGRPDAVDLAAQAGSEVVDVRERTSWSVGPRGSQAVTETDFVLRALGIGRVSPARACAVVSGDSTWVDVPAVDAVAAPLAAPAPVSPRSREMDVTSGVRAEGVPPEGSGRSGIPPVTWGSGGPRAAPGVAYTTPPGAAPPNPGPYQAPGLGSGSPYGQAGWASGSPYGQSGWGMAPPGRSWAASADQDPAWLDLIPRLEGYHVRAEDAGGLVTLQAGVTPARVYEGQQATLVATASFAPEALALLGPGPEILPPSASDAWSVDIPYAPPTPAAVGGRVKEAHTFMRAFFPVAPGRLALDGVRLRYSVGGGGAAHTPGEELATEPLSAEVSPIPTDAAPPGWNGAVGRFRVAAWVDPQAVTWGEAAYLTVEVAGAGNVQALPRPDPGPVWGAELRPIGERAQVEVRDGVVGGVKTFTWLVVPVEPATVRIGPVIYSFFDPWVEGFGQVASGEVVLEARPLPALAEGSTPESAVSDFGQWHPPWDGGGADTAAVPVADMLMSRAPAAPGAGVPVPGTTPSAPSTLEAAAEADVRRALDSLAAYPREASLWVELASAYQGSRPDEGWKEWALLNGLVRAPRDGPLRAALRGDARWPELATGLPVLRLSPVESLGAAAGLGAGALAALAAAFGVAAGPGRRRTMALALVLLAAGAVSLEPWIRLGVGDRPAVIVEGPALLRAAPSWSAPETGSLAGGSPVALQDRFGDWVKVSARGGAVGWTEAVRTPPLDPSFGR